MTAKLKIKKGDNVVVITGRDKGKTGEVMKVHARRGPRDRAGREHGEAPYDAAPGSARRHRREGSVDPRLQRRPYRSQGHASRRAWASRSSDGRKVRDSRAAPAK